MTSVSSVRFHDLHNLFMTFKLASCIVLKSLHKNLYIIQKITTCCRYLQVNHSRHLIIKIDSLISLLLRKNIHVKKTITKIIKKNIQRLAGTEYFLALSSPICAMKNILFYYPFSPPQSSKKTHAHRSMSTEQHQNIEEEVHIKLSVRPRRIRRRTRLNLEPFCNWLSVVGQSLCSRVGLSFVEQFQIVVHLFILMFCFVLTSKLNWKTC